MKDRRLSGKTGLILLGLVALVFRYPITESPSGADNFFYITQVKAILYHGEIFWAENPLSLYGLFPGTTPLGSIMLATAFTEVSGLSVHHYHLFSSFFLSLFFTFGTFILAGEFTTNYRSRWFSALAFSLAPRFLMATSWRFSLRFSLIAMLPFFLWLILRLVNEKYGRKPLKLLILLLFLTLLLPSFHRIGLLLPGFFLSFIISIVLWQWQEKALNRERAGRQLFSFIFILAAYLFYLQYLDFSPYSPDNELIGVYYLNEGSILSSIINLGFYYLINAGPITLLSLIGMIFWIQEGRVPFSYIFAFTLLALSLFIISDIIYIPYIFTFFILLFVAPGIDFFLDNLHEYKIRLGVFLISLLLLTVTFSNLDLSYRVSAHEKEEFHYSFNVRESSISAGYWIDENFNSEILESNDIKRDRRIIAYTDSFSSRDLGELSSNRVNISEMNIERRSIMDLYWYSEDHLWKWTNKSNQTQFDYNLSIVNLGMANFTGRSSTSSMLLSSYYKNMPNYNFDIYSNDELSLYWTKNY